MAHETSISRHFASLPDPRIERSQAHRLIDIVTIALCAVLCGAETWVDIETFGRAKQAWLTTFLALPNGIPSHDTFGRVFARLDPAAFQRCFLNWVQTLAPQPTGQIAVDGKTLRRSHDRTNGKAALHLVSAWASEQGLVLGQLAVEDKSNEITAIPALLALLDLQGCIVTLDAMGTQKAIVAQIVEQGGDYIVALKQNHPALLEEVAATFALARTQRPDVSARDRIVADTAHTVEKGHGRREQRRVWTITDPAILQHLDPAGDWAKLRSLGLIEDTRHIGETTSSTRRYFLASLDGAAAPFGQVVRAHWGIENRVHWLLDVVFREDDARTRVGHSAQNFAVLRHVALNLLRQDRSTKGSLATKRFTAALDDSYLARLLTQSAQPGTLSPLPLTFSS